MLFNSLQYAVFLPIVLALYWIVPHKWRWTAVLVSSYYFYMCWNAKYLLLLIMFITGISYVGALGVEGAREQKQKKLWVGLVIAVSLALLFVFKYFNFLSETLYSIFSMAHIDAPQVTLNLLLPVGISFYTFQSIGYIVDVYRGDIEAEHHVGKYAAFVAFFPQLVAGPIERASNLMPQLKTERHFSVVCKCAVPIFFMVSGRLLMEREESLRIILKKRVFRFAVVLVLFSMAVYCAGNIMSGKNEFSIREVIKIVYRGTDIGTYWFLYAYVGVLLILPFIRSMRNVLTDTNMYYLFALRIVFLRILPVTIFAALGHPMGTLLKLYIVETPIFFFLSGYYFGTTEHYQKGKYRYLLLVASCVCVAISAFMTTYQFQTGGQYTEDFLD